MREERPKLHKIAAWYPQRPVGRWLFTQEDARTLERALTHHDDSDIDEQDRKYFDSGDYMMSKAGVQSAQAPGTAIPTPEGYVCSAIIRSRVWRGDEIRPRNVEEEKRSPGGSGTVGSWMFRAI
jgi:hypothetical protein